LAKQAALRLARSLGLFALARRVTASGVRILCYHGLWLGEDGFAGDAMFMRRETFETRLDRLKALGYPVVTLEAAAGALAGMDALPPNAVVITIDDGWYSTFAGMVPALARHAMPATLYCDSAAIEEGLPIAHVMARYCRMLVDPARIDEEAEALYRSATDFTQPMAVRLDSARAFCQAVGLDPDRYERLRVFAYMTPEELRAARAAGLSIELHTHRHTLGDMSDATVADEIAANRAALARLLAAQPSAFRHFCYPSGVTSAEAATALDALGLASSTTTVNGLAFQGAPMQLLPRFLDGEQVSMIEFEAELSGFMHLVREALGFMRRRSGAVHTPIAATIPQAG